MYYKISLSTTREHKGEFRRQKNKCAVFDVPLLGSQVCFSSFKVKPDEQDALQEFRWHWRMIPLIKYSPAAHFFLPIAAPAAQSCLASHLRVPAAYRFFTAVVYRRSRTAVSEPRASEMQKTRTACGVACPKCRQPPSSDQDRGALISLIHPARHLYLPRLIDKNIRRQGRQTF